MTTRKGFTLIELMVVILIVGILAAASIPLMRGRIDSAKWAEANSTAGTIKSAVRVYFAEKGTSAAVIGNLGTTAIQTALGFQASDLTGTYFLPGDYAITQVNSDGVATVTATSNQANAPKPVATKTLDVNGNWL